jgi:hypothetical protein
MQFQINDKCGSYYTLCSRRLAALGCACLQTATANHTGTGWLILPGYYFCKTI